MPTDRYMKGVLTVIAILLAGLLAERFLHTPDVRVRGGNISIWNSSDSPIDVRLSADHRPIAVKTERRDFLQTKPFEPPIEIPGFTFPLSRP